MQDGDKKKSNPVVQRVKVIMALGLVVVHLHSRFLSQVTGVTLPFSSPTTSLTTPTNTELTPDDSVMEQIPLNDYLIWKAFNLSTDQFVTIGLAILLLLKYTFYDKPTPSTNSLSTPPSPLQEPVLSTVAKFPSETKDITSLYFRKRSINLETIPEVNSLDELVCNNQIDYANLVPTAVNTSTQTDDHSDYALAKFSISSNKLSDDSDSDSIEEMSGHDNGSMPPPPPRSVSECLKIYNTEVCTILYM